MGILGMLAPHAGGLEVACQRWPEIASNRAFHGRYRPILRPCVSVRVKVPPHLLAVAHSPWIRYAIANVVMYGAPFLAEVENA